LLKDSGRFYDEYVLNWVTMQKNVNNINENLQTNAHAEEAY